MLTLTGHRRAVRALAYAPGPEPLLASTGDDRELRLWDVSAWRERCLLGNRYEVRHLAFGPDGRTLAAMANSQLSVYHIVEGGWELDGRCSFYGSAVSVAVSATGDAVLAGLRNASYSDDSGAMIAWDLKAPQLLPRRLPWFGVVWSATFCPARDLFAIGRLDRCVELWPVGGELLEPVAFLPNRINVLAFSSAGDVLAAASGQDIYIIDVAARVSRCVCKGHKAVVKALAFSPDGTRLLTGAGDASVRQWDAASGREMMSWDWKIGAVHAVAFAPDGMTAAAAGDRPTIVVWDIDE